MGTYSKTTQILNQTFTLLLINLWPLWLLFLFLFVVKIVPTIFKLYKLTKAGLPEVDKMTGTEFEIFLEQLFIRLGYKVQLVGGMADYGADLILEKDGIRTVVQAKCWRNPVPVKAVQEINTAKAHYDASEAMVITNSRFTQNAKILAKENGVKVIDREILATLIITTPSDKN